MSFVNPLKAIWAEGRAAFGTMVAVPHSIVAARQTRKAKQKMMRCIGMGTQDGRRWCNW